MAVIKNVKIYKENELIDAAVITEGNLIKKFAQLLLKSIQMSQLLMEMDSC